MNTCRHEAAHAVAIHLLNLTDTLRPGGAAVRADGGGIVALDCGDVGAVKMRARAAGTDCNSDEPCAPAVAAARERPELVPALILFMLAGYGANTDHWRGDLGRTIVVRMSSDSATVRQIIMDLAGSTGYAAQDLASESTRDALDRAAAWCALPHVRTLIDRAAAHLEKNGAASWSELTTIFTHDDASRLEPLALPPCAASESPLAEATLATLAGQTRDPATVGNHRAEPIDTKAKSEKCIRMN